MRDLGHVYADAQAGSLSLTDERSIWLEQWRHVPLSTVWARRLTLPGSPDLASDIFFVKAHGQQYRRDIPYQTFTPTEAQMYAELIAEDFAAHSIKTDPEQIYDALVGLVVEYLPQP